MAITTPHNQDERLQLANELYREFHTRCFWHSPRVWSSLRNCFPS
jgi:hypothetical protein